MHLIPRETPIWEGAQLSSVWDDAFDKQQVALLAKDFPTRFSAGISGKELGGLKQARLGHAPDNLVGSYEQLSEPCLPPSMGSSVLRPSVRASCPKIFFAPS